MMVLDSFLRLRRHAFQVSLKRRPGIEIEHRPQQLFDLFNRQVRNVMIKNQVHIRSARIVNWVLPTPRTHCATTNSHLQMLIPFLFLDRTTVDLETNVIAPHFHLGDDCAVARLDRRAPQRELPFQDIAAGRELPIFQGESGLAHGKLGADIHKVSTESPDEFHPVLLSKRGFLVFGAGSHYAQKAYRNEYSSLARPHTTTLFRIIDLCTGEIQQLERPIAAELPTPRRYPQPIARHLP